MSLLVRRTVGIKLKSAVVTCLESIIFSKFYGSEKHLEYNRGPRSRQSRTQANEIIFNAFPSLLGTVNKRTYPVPVLQSSLWPWSARYVPNANDEDFRKNKRKQGQYHGSSGHFHKKNVSLQPASLGRIHDQTQVHVHKETNSRMGHKVVNSISIHVLNLSYETILRRVLKNISIRLVLATRVDGVLEKNRFRTKGTTCHLASGRAPFLGGPFLFPWWADCPYEGTQSSMAPRRARSAHWQWERRNCEKL